MKIRVVKPDAIPFDHQCQFDTDYQYAYWESDTVEIDLDEFNDYLEANRDKFIGYQFIYIFERFIQEKTS
jgi:hypothetical protein